MPASFRRFLVPLHDAGGAHEHRHDFLHGDFDELALAGAQLLSPSGGNSERGLHACAGIRHRGAGLDRRAVRFARDRERSRCRLCKWVEALPLRVGPGQAVALDPCVDDAGVQGAEDVVAEVQVLHDARAEVFDEDIELRHEGEKEVTALRLLQVQDDGALVAVVVEEVLRILGAGGERTAGRVALGRFDLDHVGTKPGKHLGARRARFVLGHIEDAQAIEGGCHRFLLT